MNEFNKQKGSAHIVVITALVLVVLAVLGFVFWQSFLKQDDSEKNNQSTETTSEQAGDLLTATFNPAFGSSTSFEYPSTWKLERTLTGPTPIDETGKQPTDELIKVTSPSGNNSVEYRIYSTGGVGGTCDLDSTPYEVAQMEYDSLDTFKGVIFSQLTIKNNASSTYSYNIGLKRASFAQGLTVGDPVCLTTASLAGFLGIDNDRTVNIVANIKSLDDDKGVSLNVNNIDTITDAYSGLEYTQMKAILLSTQSVLSEV